MARWLRAVVAFVFVCIGAVPTSSAQTQTAVEYYHTGWNYYFVTSFPPEILALDGGAFGGVWKRTGQTFSVWSTQEAGTSAVCRFFSTSFAPRSSHFYTPYAEECDEVKRNPDWQYEAIAFYLKTPDGNGNCPAGSAPMYRLYNNGMGGAPNHRYATSRATVEQMRAQGWISEGSGPDGTNACTPSSGGPATAEGIWSGTTDRNETVRAIILDDGTYYILYSKPGNAIDAGVFQGSGTAIDGNFSSPKGMNFAIANALETNGSASPVSLSGSYAPRSSLQLTLTDHLGTRNLAATYIPGSEQPPSLTAVAGTYTGVAGHIDGRRPATFTLSIDGNITGSNDVCAFKGTMTPRNSVDAFDWTLRAIGGPCRFGSGPISGVMYYDEATRKIRGFAPFDGRSNQYYLIGTKP